MNFFWSKTYERKCPDGTIRIIHKNIDTAFPLYVESAHSKTSIELQGLKKIQGKLSQENQTKIEGMLYELDDINRALVIKFRSAYVLFQASPCNGYEVFSQEILKINNEHHRLTVLKAKIKLVIDLAGNNNVNSLPKQILGFMDEFKANQIAGIEIDSSRSLMKKIKEDENGI